MKRLLILSLTMVCLMAVASARAQQNEEFDVGKMYLEIMGQSVHLMSKADQKTALNLMENRPFALTSPVDMNNPQQQYRYYNTLGYYAALGLEHPDWAPAWVASLSKLSGIGQQGMITAINNIGAAPENTALAMVFQQAPALKVQLDRIPRNILEFPPYTREILATLNGAFYATGQPKYTALMVKGLAESFPGGRQPDAIMSHLIPYFLQMHALLDPTAHHVVEFSATLPEVAMIAPLLRAIADHSLIDGDDPVTAMSDLAKLKYFFDHMRAVVAEIAAKNLLDN